MNAVVIALHIPSVFMHVYMCFIKLKELSSGFVFLSHG